MDHTEFSRRLRQLAGNHSAAPHAFDIDYSLILGSLGYACMMRRAQAAILALVLLPLGFVCIDAVGLSPGYQTWAAAFLYAVVTVAIVRHVPYWTPRKAVGEGLLALSRYQLNDFEQFIANQRTNLTVVNNKLLSDLCVQLAMDKCRPKVHSSRGETGL